jgi:hypothetical protein
MEGMSKGMRERMAEYSRRLEAVASGDTAGCQSRKCGSRHSRKRGQPEELERGQHREQRQRAVGPRRRPARPRPPRRGGGESSSAAAAQGSTIQTSPPPLQSLFITPQLSSRVTQTTFVRSSITPASIFLASSVSMISSERFAVSLGRPDVVDLGALLVSDAHST